MSNEDFYEPPEEPAREPDARENQARVALEGFIEGHKESVFFSRQLEVQNEDEWYHWITNRALRELVGRGLLRTEVRGLRTGGSIHLMWHRNHRYYRRDAKRVVQLVEEYSDPNIGGALGLQGEALVLEGFARSQFVMRNRDTRSHGGRTWTQSDHDLDFVFERDDRVYGVEVKNTLRYIDYSEFSTKIEMCRALGIRPVFAVRMLPKSWIHEVIGAGGFALILKHQLYPWAHRDLARRVKMELGLPVDAPRALEGGTMARFLRWHEGL
ncbi:MAG: hypothetical protein HYY76_16820 [Acidobacteria bacterium]|nr:hypothetical protein [Acidobacteriota bacterium]